MQTFKCYFKFLFLALSISMAACSSGEETTADTQLAVTNIYHNSVSLTINPFEDATQCEVLCTATDEVKTITIGEEPKVIEFKNLTPKTNYLFEARYYDASKRIIKKSKIKVTTKIYEGPTVKISLAGSYPESLSIKYEIEDDAAYFYCTQGKTVSSSDKKYTKSRTVSYYDLKPNTEYQFSAIAYDADGKSAGSVTAEFKTKSIPYTNYVCIDGTYIELYTVEMSTDREYSGTGTGSNWKYLKFHGPKFNNSVTQVVFFYVVPEWEGINNYWPDGTYYINGNSSGYYRYGGYMLYKGHLYKGDGKVKISSNGSMQTFDFDIDSDYSIKGHFIGVDK